MYDEEISRTLRESWDGIERRGLFNPSLHPRGTGAQGGQFVAKGTSGANDNLGYDSKRGTGTGYGTNGKGDKRVKQLQTALNRLGFKDSQGNPLKVDGHLGPRTTSAIKRLQKRLGLKADGIVTPQLLKKIRSAASPKGLGPSPRPRRAAKKAAPGAVKPATPARQAATSAARKMAPSARKAAR